MSKNKLSIEVDANSSKLARKLKAIAKHTEALANELEEIDKEEKEDDDLKEFTTKALINELKSRKDVNVVDKDPTVYHIGIDLSEAKDYTIVVNNFDKEMYKQGESNLKHSNKCYYPPLFNNE
jgi:hypothetical protein